MVTVSKTHIKPEPEHRQTQEELQKEIEERAKREKNKRDTINYMAEIGAKANAEANEFMGNVLFYNLKGRTLANKHDDQKRAMCQLAGQERLALKDSVAYRKAESKFIDLVKKKILKLKKKSYKKAKKKYGKKIAKIVFYTSQSSIRELWQFEDVGSKKYQELVAKLDEEAKAFDKEKYENQIDCPRLTGNDLSFNDHSFNRTIEAQAPSTFHSRHGFGELIKEDDVISL